MTQIMDLFRLDGRVAVVTGGAGLLGAGFSRALVQAGASVLIADSDLERAQQVATELSDFGVTRPFEMDVTCADSAKAMATAARETFGRLDILVCSAGLDPKFDAHQNDRHTVPFEDYPLQAWRQTLEINLTGAFLSAQAAAPLMLSQGSGVMIMIASIYGLAGPDQRLYQQPGQPAQYKPADYAVSKAGLLGLTRHLAAYYGGKGIRVNALSPGGVFNDHAPDFVHAYSARAMLGRMADKDEMNAALLFLASDASSYMTGANLVVDGGWTAW